MWIILKKRPVRIAMKSDCEKDVRKDAFANNFQVAIIISIKDRNHVRGELFMEWNIILESWKIWWDTCKNCPLEQVPQKSLLKEFPWQSLSGRCAGWKIIGWKIRNCNNDCNYSNTFIQTNVILNIPRSWSRVNNSFPFTWSPCKRGRLCCPSSPALDQLSASQRASLFYWQ